MLNVLERKMSCQTRPDVRRTLILASHTDLPIPTRPTRAYCLVDTSLGQGCKTITQDQDALFGKATPRLILTGG